ncbi:MAG: hypothetical protein CML12_02265 [Puniceicoccaceae bacterium]|nr:hypothetical protein [Puniceicoccaceae bacterium]RCL30312.1 MAG: glycosyltransferase family 2 protein [Puniceicoccaceae bacterium]|tara:strand:+ start:31 stop:915 length:885 start_codon:yes stop_codon:yes gene_type:complete
MKENLLVSVIIPVFNRKESLLKAIDSVLIQGDQIAEIIVIDDASSIDIKGSLESIGSDKIQYYQNSENLGAAASRNIGVSKALSDWIAFLDSDDVWYAGKITKQFNALNKNKAEICYSSVDTNSNKQLVANYSDNILSPLLQKGNIVVGGFSGLLMKKKAFLNVGGINEKLKSRQDYELHLRLSLNNVKYTFVKESLLFFKTIGSDRITTNHYSRILGIIRVLKLHKILFLNSKGYRYIYDFEELIFRIRLLNKPKTCNRLLFYFLKHYQTSVQSLALTLSRFFRARVRNYIGK